MPLIQGQTYRVTTMHRFEGRYVGTEILDASGTEVHVFESGSKVKGGLPGYRKVPTGAFVAAEEIADGHQPSG